MRAPTMAALQILTIAPLSLCDYANPALLWFDGHMSFTSAFHCYSPLYIQRRRSIAELVHYHKGSERELLILFLNVNKLNQYFQKHIILNSRLL